MNEVDSKPTVINKDWTNIVLVVMVLFGFVSAFLGGMVLQRTIISEQRGTEIVPPPIVAVTPTIIELPDGDVSEVQPGTGMLKDKAYFDDTVMLVSEETPRQVLVATVTRSDKGNIWQQTGRVSFFDGEKWTRKTNNGTTESSEIASSSLIKKWKIEIDPSRVLKQSVKGEVTVGTNQIGFETGLMTNEIGMRSLPGYTKFMSNGNGIIIMNGRRIPAKLIYTRIYSMNSVDIQFYSGQFGLMTDWIAFWDNEGNFYHIDKTNVVNPTEIYKTHEIGILEDKNGSVTKTFSVSVTRDNQMPPEKYEVGMATPLGVDLLLVRGGFIDKAPNGSFKWFMGTVEGTVKTKTGERTGFGVVEYIQN